MHTELAPELTQELSIEMTSDIQHRFETDSLIFAPVALGLNITLTLYRR